MNKLSQELVDNIISNFDPWWDSGHLKRLLTVSKPFQNSVERLGFAQYQLSEDNAERFLCQYTAERARYLRYVQCVPTFPKAYGHRNWDEGCRENANELLEKDEIFTRQIGSLFRTLKCLEDRVGIENIRGKLHLTIYTPRRKVEDNPCRHLVCVCRRVRLLNPETLPRISSIHTLEFQDATGFSPASRMYQAPCVSRFHYAPSKLDLRVLMDLASKIMSLKQLECRFLTYFRGMHATDECARHFMQDWAGPHRDTRHDFAKPLDSITLPSLKRIDLNFHTEGEQFGDQREVLPNLILPRQYDPFSTSLRVLSYQLETMVLRVTVDQTLFWPTDGTTPHWPHLKYLDVFFRAHSPSGEWYFQGPRGEGSDTSPGYEITQAHYEPMEANATDRFYDRQWFFDRELNETVPQFRIVPVDRTLRPLLVAFAKAASNMPSLRIALLRTGLEFYPGNVYDNYDDLSTEIDAASASIEDLGWGIAYTSPGERLQNDEVKICDSLICKDERCRALREQHEAMRLMWKHQTNCASRQFWWWTQDWRPDETLYPLFDKIGQFEHGNEAIHHWLSDQGQKWYGQRLFDDFIQCPEGVPERFKYFLDRLWDS